jgi:16S rRNA (cytosine1402-N4)-methyltransferase
VDGVFFDLGVSSPQFDEAGRGFSFRFDGPLDMRMDPTVGIPAWQWLNEAEEKDIREVIKSYGEDRLAGPIAKAIVARRADSARPALKTTKQLATLVAGVVRRRATRAPVGKNEATRTFQAIRIFLNQELEELTLVLSVAIDKLAVNGRLVVISFHSLEDRIVKEFVARESGRRAARDPIYGQPVHESPVRLQDLGRVLPTNDETAVNPRARSAVMRVARRLGGGSCDA